MCPVDPKTMHSELKRKKKKLIIRKKKNPIYYEFCQGLRNPSIKEFKIKPDLTYILM